MPILQKNVVVTRFDLVTTKNVNQWYLMILLDIMRQSRTAILIHCSQEEANRIREAALRERRTISGFVLNAVMSRFEVEARVTARRDAHRHAAEEKVHSGAIPHSLRS